MQATLLVGFALQQLSSSGSKTEPEQPRFSAEASSASTVTLSQTQTVWSADLELGGGDQSEDGLWPWMRFYLQARGACWASHPIIEAPYAAVLQTSVCERPVTLYPELDPKGSEPRSH